MDISKIKIGESTYDIKDTWVAFAGASASTNGTAGYVPAPAKGSQSKFFKADGTWADPANTTYTFANGTNGFKVTPLGGTAQTVTVTPSITNNVVGNAAWNAANSIITTNAASGNTVKQSGVSIAESSVGVTDSDTLVPTSKAVLSYVSTQIGSALTSALKYKGSVGTGGTVAAIPTSGNTTGDVYVVKTAGTYDGQVMEVGDYLIYNGSGWDKINGENQVDNKSASLAAPGSPATIATVDGTNITVTTPSTWKITDTDTKVTSAANHYAPTADANSELTAAISGPVVAFSGAFDTNAAGTVSTSVTNAEFTVLTGVKAQRDEKGHITGLTYTAQEIKDTRWPLMSTTFGTRAAVAMGTTKSRQYAVGLDTAGKLSVNIPWTDTNTKVTSAANHYVPASGETDVEYDASGANGTAGSSVQVVTGVVTDPRGHVVGVTSGAATDTIVEYSYDSATETLELFNLNPYVAPTPEPEE